MLRDSPILKALFTDSNPPVELVVVLTPHVAAPPPTVDVMLHDPQPPVLQRGYTLQVGAFQDRAKASALIAELEKRHQDVFLQEASAEKPLYRVRVGRVASLQEVKELQKRLRSEGLNSFISQLK
jgi:cell division septation protein DedD